MRIGVNALYLIPGGVGGTEIYLRCLLAALAEIDRDNHYFVFANAETDSQLCPAQANFRLVRQPVPARFRPARILWEQTALPLSAAAARCDVLFNPGFTAPLLAPCPYVTVFHDLQHKRHPEFFRWFDLPFWRLFLWIAARRSKLILTVSETTRRDFLRYYPRAEPEVLTVLPGVDPMFFDIGRRRQQRSCRPYFLCAATLHPHKNLETLIEAFAEFRRERPDFRLVLAGLKGFATRSLLDLIRQRGLEDAVQVTGWLPRSQFYELFVDACAFVYPSRFEGFGLPVLEALAAGVPTACSAIEPLASLAADAALLFDPADRAALLAALRRLVQDPTLRERLSRAGPERAAEFSWRRSAELTLAALRRAAGSRG